MTLRRAPRPYAGRALRLTTLLPLTLTLAGCATAQPPRAPAPRPCAPLTPAQLARVRGPLRRYARALHRIYRRRIRTPTVCFARFDAPPPPQASSYAKVLLHLAGVSTASVAAPTSPAGRYSAKHNRIELNADLDFDEQRLADTLAHELVHAARGFEGRHALAPGGLGADARLARRCVAEGEATLVGTLLSRGLLDADADADDAADAVRRSFAVSTSTSALGALIRHTGYTYGACVALASRVVHQHGVDGLDRLWRDPPASTEQTLSVRGLFGPRDAPTAVSPPPSAALAALGYRAEVTGDLGQVALHRVVGGLFGHVVTPGWDGAAFTHFTHPDRPPVTLVHAVWDTARQMDTFLGAYLLALGLRRAPDAPPPSPDAVDRPYRAIEIPRAAWVWSQGHRFVLLRTDEDAVGDDVEAEAAAWLGAPAGPPPRTE